MQNTFANIEEIICQYWRNHLSLLKKSFCNIDKSFCNITNSECIFQYWKMISSILTNEFFNIDKWFLQYWIIRTWTNWADTWRVFGLSFRKRTLPLNTVMLSTAVDHPNPYLKHHNKPSPNLLSLVIKITISVYDFNIILQFSYYISISLNNWLEFKINCIHKSDSLIFVKCYEIPWLGIPGSPECGLTNPRSIWLGHNLYSFSRHSGFTHAIQL